MFDKFGAILKVDGKTGARPIRLVKSTPSLHAWTNTHPFKDNPDAPLWINFNSKSYGQSMTYPSAYKMVKRRCELAGLSKRVYLNLFRHTEATRMANFMTEAQMRKRHGWTPYSKMPGRYVHLVNSDVEDAILSHYGLSNKEELTEKGPVICSICETPNEPDSKLCSTCIKPLDLSTALDLEEKDKMEKETLRSQISQVKEEFEQKIEELKFGPFGRRSNYSKAILESENDPKSRFIINSLTLLIELVFSEEKKRNLWKELERAKQANEKPDLKSALGEPELLTKEQKLALLEKLKNKTKIVEKGKYPKLIIEQLEEDKLLH